MATEKILTVRDLIQSLNEMVKRSPKCLDYPIIYSHDDEGNEFQRVINKPDLVQLHDPKHPIYRNLEVVGFRGQKDISDRDLNAVIIN